MDGKIRLILVGGFLGAGKTTLLARAAAVLIQRGRKIGLITNDQAAGLVDTEIAKQVSNSVREVSGGCFCCRFGDLVDSLKGLLRDFSPDVVLAEPVGSCTDLSATVLQPMKQLYAEMLTVAPYSVLADPTRLAETLAPRAGDLFPESVRYIYRKQLEEADLIVLNKTDLLDDASLAGTRELHATHFPDRRVVATSALDGRGVEAWVDLVTADGPAGRWIVPVDYETYARGEAELGWLNAVVRLRARTRVDWKTFANDLLDRLRDACRARSAEIAHLKILLEAPGQVLTGNVTGLSAEPSVRGDIEGVHADVSLLINARVHLDPAELRGVVEGCLAAVAGDLPFEVAAMQSFRPGRPEPTHRYDRIV